MQTTTISFFVYGPPCLVIYALVVRSVIKLRRQLSDAFVHIFLINAVLDIMMYVNSYPTYRLRTESFFGFYYEWINQIGWFRYIQWYMTAVFFYLSNMNTFLFTFNRFSSIIFSTRHAKIWRRPYIPIILAISTGLLVSITRLSVHMHYAYDNKTQSHIVVYDTEASMSSIVQTAFGSSVLLLNLIMSSISICSLSSSRRRLLSSSSSASLKQQRTELSLLLISLCIFGAQAFNIACVLATAIFAASDSVFGLYITGKAIPYAADSLCLGPAVYTILLPGPIRNDAVASLRRAFSSCFPVRHSIADINSSQGVDTTTVVMHIA